MVSAKKTIKELEKQDWFQQMQQEEEGAAPMIIEENTPDKHTQKKIAPARENLKPNGESATETRRKRHIQT
jgi:hypothetical protein